MVAGIILLIVAVAAIGCFVLAYDITKNGRGDRAFTAIFLFWASGVFAGTLAPALLNFISPVIGK